MNWNEHSDLRGRHATLSPSSAKSWFNYSDETNDQLFKRAISEYASQQGTIIHDYVKDRIIYKLEINEFEKNDILLELLRNGIPRKMIDVDQFFQTVMEYTNDAIEFGLTPELPLFYSSNCYGTCDTIGYAKRYLRIHDLKTGNTPAHFEQLEAYTALFFLEYGKKLKIKPETTNIELRLYQLGEISIYSPEPETIYDRMDKIIRSSAALDIFKSGG